LTEYELCFAADLIEPASLDVSWHDIGGLDHVIRSIKETVIFPFIRRDLLRGSNLMQPPKGQYCFAFDEVYASCYLFYKSCNAMLHSIFIKISNTDD
jgi:ATP-dependent 26S proteasome regulatory subunit